MAGPERRRDLLLLLQHLDDESRASVIQQILAGGEEAVHQDVDEYVSLAVFAAGEDAVISHEKPVGYVAAAAPVEERSLAPRVQVAIWSVIQAFMSLFDLDICPENITAANITIEKTSMKPKLIGLKVKVKTAARVESCMASLATIFESELVLIRPPPHHCPLEIKHLLTTMRTNAVALLPVIRYHPALVPMENRPDYLTRMYGYARYILLPNDRAGYDYVINNVAYPANWDDRLKTNTFLDNFFQSAPDPYNPQGKSANNPQGILANNPQMAAAAATEAAKEALRYNRNLPAHGLKMSPHKPSPNGMLFTRTDMARMLYSVMDGILCSVATSLQRIDHFNSLDIQSLFPGRVVKAKKP